MTYAERAARRREILIIVGAFAIPAILLLPLFRMSTEFTASLRTKSVRFTTAPWKESPGLFSFDDLPLDLRVSEFERMEMLSPSERTVFRPAPPVRLRGARLSRLDMSQPLNVSLGIGGGGELIMTVERIGTSENELALIRVDSETQLPAGMQQCSSKWSCEWAVYGRGNILKLILTPTKGQLQAESHVPLSDGSGITFQNDNGESAIVAPGEAQITALDRKFTIKQPVSFKGLKGAVVESLTPDPQGIKLVINQGSSNSIQLGGENAAATLAEYLASRKPLTSYLSMVVLIGSAILTILTRLKVIKKEDKT